jgi:hypothetical protein
MRNDVVESPHSKQKYKLISREMKELEKCGSFEKVMKGTLTKIVSMNIP